MLSLILKDTNVFIIQYDRKKSKRGRKKAAVARIFVDAPKTVHAVRYNKDEKNGKGEGYVFIQ
jgi:hypothetical protein